MQEPCKELSPIALGKASAEVRGFLAQFSALTVVLAAFEEAGGLEGRLGALRQEIEELPAKRRSIEEGIVGEFKEKIEKLRHQTAGLTEVRDKIRTEIKAAQEALEAVTSELERSQGDLRKVKAELARIRSGIAV